MKNQSVASCFETICVSCSDWPISTTPRTLSASETSYETSCAHVRIEPSSEYFDSDAQPPTMKPYTPIEPSAKTRISAIGTSATSPWMYQPLTSQPGPNGITAERGERRERGDDRRDDVRQVARGGREERLLADQLDQVGDRLQEAERAGAVRAVALLQAAEHLAFEPRQVRERQQQRG